jgi:hypothetical protein
MKIKEINLKTAKPGIYFCVTNDHITKMDFVRYYETTNEEYCGYGEYETRTTGYIEYRHRANGALGDGILETKLWNACERYFENFDDAKEYVIERYYKRKIRDFERIIEGIKDDIKRFEERTVEDKIWLV